MKSPAKELALLGIACASALGCASMAALAVFLFHGGFDLFPLGLDPWAALGCDALLSAAFFAQHSGMVRHSFRERLGRVVPAPFHGLVYTAASGVVIVLCVVFWQSTGEPLLLLDGFGAASMRAVFLLAVVGIGWGVFSLGKFDAFGVGPVLALVRGREPRDQPIVVRGPYRWVRHPLYFFMILLVWSCPVITTDRLLFNILWSTWIVLATVLEERDLVSQFGASYVRYQEEVPMIVPWRLPARRTPG